MDERREKSILNKKKLERQKRRQRLFYIRFFLAGIALLLSFCIGRMTSSPVSSQDGIQNDDQQQGRTFNDKDMTTVALEEKALSKGALSIVNKNQPMIKWNENEMINLNDKKSSNYMVKSKSLQVCEEIVEPLNQMLDDFTNEAGENDIIVVSGYRDFETQERLHYESLLERGKEETNQFVARPGQSEHHTGYAVDFGLYHSDGTSSDYDGTGQYAWLQENCYKYGFILRYKKEKKSQTMIEEEPWHFRYVGQPHALLMKELDMCLEEYIAYLKDYTYYDNPRQGIIRADKKGEDEGRGYSIYYVPAQSGITNVPVPKEKSYTISGDNKEGYIVTVKLVGEKKTK